MREAGRVYVTITLHTTGRIKTRCRSFRRRFLSHGVIQRADEVVQLFDHGSIETALGSSDEWSRELLFVTHTTKMTCIISSCRAVAVWAVLLSGCHLVNAASIEVVVNDVEKRDDFDKSASSFNDVIRCPSRSCDCRTVGDDDDDVIARCRALPVVFDAGDSNLDVWSPPLAGLSFARAGLSSLPAGSPFFRLPTRALDLSGNPLTKSGNYLDDAFDGLDEVLRVLSMADCSLTRVPSRALRNLTELRTLQLDGNKVGAW